MQCLTLAVLDVQEGFNSIGGETTSFLALGGGGSDESEVRKLCRRNEFGAVRLH